ncbi:S-adenosyl-L-methionine-dependent methyltransferase [Syncephalis plumigaleata]|nr:S-adenosyl-L-methionine-dependent methyltransferase [Syncephalis plumigaleata]
MLQNEIGSVSNERRENGYILEMSIEEIDRLNHIHNVFVDISGTLHHVSLDNPRHVVDIGSGTGIWMKNMAMKFPDTQFHGVDLFVDVCQEHILPNCKYIQHNVFNGLPFGEQSIDYVHQQLFNIVVRTEQWPQLCADYYRVLAPGGQVEIAEIDGTQLSKGPAAQRMENWIMQSLKQRQLDLGDIHRLPQLLADTGFIGIEHRIISIPTGCTAGKYGEMAWLGWNSFARIMLPLLLDDGVAAWEFEQTMLEWQREVKELPSITQLHVYSARRPGSATTPSQTAYTDTDRW